MSEGRLLKPLPVRDWRAYSKGQTQEVRLFDLLLTDLVSTLIQEAPPKRRGRPAIPLHELAWCAIKKAHTGYSSRRNQGYVLDAQQEGLLAHAPRYNATGEFLNEKRASNVLRGLVRASALPLAGIEQDFAVDSTGFSTSNYNAYRTTKYHPIVKQPQWVKLHACVGVRTNIVTDAIATDSKGKGTGDSPNFAPLLEATAQTFHVREVYADGAYLSKANLWHAERLGGDALIPFPTGKREPSLRYHASSNQGAPGLHGSAKLWRRAYAYFTLHEDEFYARYHMRSNVEATFGALKQTLGEHLKSKNLRAQQNEVLCKVVAWNIRCVVRAMVEFGAEAKF